jgi:hypothetical protein
LCSTPTRAKAKADIRDCRRTGRQLTDLKFLESTPFEAIATSCA